MDRRLTIFVWCALLVVALCISGSAFAETVILKSGQKIEGRISEKSDRYIKVDTSCVPVTYFFDQIESIDGRPVSSSVTISSSTAGGQKTLQVGTSGYGGATNTAPQKTLEVTTSGSGYYYPGSSTTTVSSSAAGGQKTLQVDTSGYGPTTSTTISSQGVGAQKTLQVDTTGYGYGAPSSTTISSSSGDTQKTLQVDTDDSGGVEITGIRKGSSGTPTVTKEVDIGGIKVKKVISGQ